MNLDNVFIVQYQNLKYSYPIFNSHAVYEAEVEFPERSWKEGSNQKTTPGIVGVEGGDENDYFLEHTSVSFTHLC